MQAILWKIISAIMSVVFFISGFIPGSNLNEPKPVEDIKVFDGVFISIIGKEKYHVFSTYEELNIYSETHYSPSVKEYVESVDKSLFEENNLVVINVLYADSSWKTKVTSVLQTGNTLEVEYVAVQDLYSVALCAEHYSTVFVTTNKLISNVKVTKLDSMEIPFMIDGSREGWFNIVDTEIHGLTEEFSGYTNVFSDFEGWKEFLDSGKYEFEEYADTIDEKYFEIKNLVAVIVSKNAREETRIEYPDIKDDNIMIDYYLVSQPGIYPDNITYQTIFVETNKNISTVTATLKDPHFSVPFVLD
ncbi:MAG: hypothetical protein IJ395_03615 [Clostridia bacterium]|nr:hypothetical protein [Clostridia bacterium]